MYKIFIPPLLGHSFTFPCSVWHVCVQTVNIWTEIRRVTPRVRMNLAWVRMTYCFKKFKRQSKKKLETGECHPWQGSLSPSHTSCRSLWLLPHPAALATAHMCLPGPSPGHVPCAALPNYELHELFLPSSSSYLLAPFSWSCLLPPHNSAFSSSCLHPLSWGQHTRTVLIRGKRGGLMYTPIF